MGVMPDRAPEPVTPLHITPQVYGANLAQLAASGSSPWASPAARTWVAKLIQYNPVQLPFDYRVERVFWYNGTTITSTNVDFGIYTADGTRIYSTGSTAASGSAAIQYVTVSTPFTLTAGTYYFAWTCDNTTSRGQANNGTLAFGVMSGLLEETTGSFGLPATMTPVRFARAWAANACGITRTTSGF